MMNYQTDLSCPVSAERINESIVRINAVITVIVTLTAVCFRSYPLMLLISADFAFRAFSSGKLSPVRFISRQLSALFQLPEKPVDAAPKKFAAGMGMVFCLLTACFLYENLYTASFIVSGLLIFFALLEGLFRFCMGSIIYTAIVRPFTKK